ncbi:3e7567a7-fedb-4333-9972-a6d3adc3bb36 [Thermothielavioides terrestris]|uniref:3e7567a7-fedb-4333-9972-a6d3adc3bb36 n=1 Tax=Thermothielavioides terrestris TaxID=2587410 RepID=A0A3S4BJ67_9PEZI|nr:3e7567a7-fedb-4333-9972-a6d3adc3bb36 [Thermothielavioides terrestris]
MSPYWMNNSCNPFYGPSGACTLGNLAVYAIDVRNAQDAVAGVRFAQANNIRLTIKNTGHDFLGRSSGAGSLALWTHNIKDIAFFNYRGRDYAGPAARLGAGVQYSDLYPVASAHSLRVLGGSCPTVGVVGGFSQGGGHGPLSAKYGLGADQVLEWEVVTADGRHITASPSQNADLYWALRGGGPGNYAVVLSVTVKAYPDGPAAGAGFTFANEDENTYWAAVSAFLKHLLVLDTLDGYMSGFTLTAQQFALDFALLPDAEAADDVTGPLEPLFAELDALNVTLVSNRASLHPNFADWFDTWAKPIYYGTNDSVGGRLIPRAAVRDNLPALVAAFRDIAENSSAVGGSALNGVAVNVTEARVGSAAASGASAVLPAWREALFTLNFGIPLAEDASWETIRFGQRWINEKQDRLRAVTPGGGTYMSEATWDNPHWKEDYFGANYEALRAVKAKYDPENLFWANAAVGSDVSWEPAADGRLCSISGSTSH